MPLRSKTTGINVAQLLGRHVTWQVNSCVAMHPQKHLFHNMMHCFTTLQLWPSEGKKIPLRQCIPRTTNYSCSRDCWICRCTCTPSHVRGAHMCRAFWNTVHNRTIGAVMPTSSWNVRICYMHCPLCLSRKMVI